VLPFQCLSIATADVLAHQWTRPSWAPVVNPRHTRQSKCVPFAIHLS
jgi:hypothetical protein